MNITYKDAGVDIGKGDLFVDKIKSMIGETYNENVVSGVGGFAALYQMDEERFLASATDGVGTKLKLAIELDQHDTIGIDLVAMCVNDLICTGARPLFFLDYLASGKLEIDTSSQVVKGIVEGCKQANTVLIGGETAEMPGMYADKHYDLAGFSVGEVFSKNIIDGKNVSEGDTIIALASSGFHSNGFSLVRKLINDNEVELKRKCLTPTKIYVKSIMGAINQYRSHIKGIANITGGGIHNIARINKDFGYKITNTPKGSLLPEEIGIISDRSGLSKCELYKTFNMGIGMVLVTDRPNGVLDYLNSINENCFELGKVTNDKKGAYLA